MSMAVLIRRRELSSTSGGRWTKRHTLALAFTGCLTRIGFEAAQSESRLW